MNQTKPRCITLEKTSLGIEFGSTRIKAVLIDEEFRSLATGSHDWENRMENGMWTYSLDEIITGLQECYRSLAQDVEQRYHIPLTTTGAIGISAMMHGYMVFDKNGQLLVPFRTWRNTCTAQAAQELTELFRFNLPQRWSVTHLFQAILNQEMHVSRINFLTTLSGFIHWRLTGQRVLGIGDASGMFPVDYEKQNYRMDLMELFHQRTRHLGHSIDLHALLPQILLAGQPAGVLTPAGAQMLDPSGRLQPGIPLCPPEGDAGTGMVFTNSVAPHTGNVSAGTSIFSMVVLDHPLKKIHPEIDLTATPDGLPVAMVHCNNCTADINAWVNIFQEFCNVMGLPSHKENIFSALFKSAQNGDPDCGGLLSYNYLSGEHIVNLSSGCPLFLYGPDSRFTLPNFMRTHLFTALTTLRIGMDILASENVRIDRLSGHGGFFKTPGVGQLFLASALRVPVSILHNAGEGGAWGMALLAAFLVNRRDENTLSAFLDQYIFPSMSDSILEPDPSCTAGFERYLEQFLHGFPIERTAADTLSKISYQRVTM